MYINIINSNPIKKSIFLYLINYFNLISSKFKLKYKFYT